MDLDTTNESARADGKRITGRDAAPSGGVIFAARTSTLGTVLAARSAEGVCAVLRSRRTAELTLDGKVPPFVDALAREPGVRSLRWRPAS